LKIDIESPEMMIINTTYGFLKSNFIFGALKISGRLNEIPA